MTLSADLNQLIELVTLVSKMRDAQKNYWDLGGADARMKLKQLEKQVDSRIKEILKEDSEHGV